MAFLVAALFAWKDLNWRVNNLETWRSTHEHTTEQREITINILRENVTKLTTMVMGQDRRLILLEDRSVDRVSRTQ
jgi:hypothetical protein